MNNLPTEPGFYWYQEAGADKWALFYLEDHWGEGKLSVLGFGDEHACRLEHFPIGHWQRCIPPDEGQECFAVSAPSGQFIEIATQEHCEYRANSLNESDMFLDGQEYDVVPVVIVRRQQ